MPAVIFPEDWEGTIEDGETELSVASKLNFETGKEGGQEFEVLKGDLVEFEDKKVRRGRCEERSDDSNSE